jgi:uncharacterized protein (TIGR02271 family)
MSEPQYVYSSDGRRGLIVQDRDQATDDRRILTVRFEDGRLLHVPTELLDLRPDGAFNLVLSDIELSEAPNATAAGAQARAVGADSAERVVLPVVAEELRVDTRRTETGVVRVRKLVHQREEQVDQPVMHEEVQIERVPIGRMVDHAPETRSEGETLIIPVLEEVLVVEKRLLLKEEVRVTRRHIEERGGQTVTLRAEEVVVERDTPTGAAQAAQAPAASRPNRTDVTEGN